MNYIAMIDSSWPRGVRENPVTMHWGLKNKDQINDDENIGVSRETSLQQNEKPDSGREKQFQHFYHERQ